MYCNLSGKIHILKYSKLFIYVQTLVALIRYLVKNRRDLESTGNRHLGVRMQPGVRRQRINE